MKLEKKRKITKKIEINSVENKNNDSFKEKQVKMERIIHNKFKKEINFSEKKE